MPNDPPRRVLPASRLSSEAALKQSAFHRAVVDAVESAIAKNAIVVVGMAQNPHCREVRKTLSDAGLDYEYLEYGSYLSKWKERLAIKLWSGWPTFPQVFVRGVLIGGADLTAAAIANGSLRERLKPPSAVAQPSAAN
jgi:monothiol glutaredoxin